MYPSEACLVLSGKDICLQVQKSAEHYTEAARDEIILLSQITEGSQHDEHCVQLSDHFEHHGPNGTHVCMIFEVRSLLAVFESCYPNSANLLHFGHVNSHDVLI